MADQTLEISDGIATILWDAEGRGANVFTREAIRSFGELVERVLADPTVHAGVVASAKPTFIAGADIAWMETLASEDPRGEAAREAELRQITDETRAIWRRLETGGKPFVAAIGGAAMGGGWELALTCHRRVVADRPDILLGLPEATLGLMPGGGGTQRLTRLIGYDKALPLMIDGTSLSPQQAKKMGLVDALVPPAELLQAAREMAGALRWEDAIQPWDRKGYVPAGPDPRTAAGTGALMVANSGILKRGQGNFPAFEAIASAAFQGYFLPIDAALEIEGSQFVKLLLDPRTRAIIRTQFINLRRANKAGARLGATPRPIRRIGVLGAGMMGAGIAHVAAKAGLEVVLIDRDLQAAEAGRAHARKLQDKAVARGTIAADEADSIIARIRPTADYALLADADVVVEAVFEDSGVKADVTKRAEAVLGPQAIFGSNTSTLPITGLAKASSRPERFIGMHFFSPVERMPLLEIIRGRETGEEALATALELARLMRKTPIIVNDSRGFFTSRVVGTYTEEGVIMLSEGIAPALIENAGRAVGMPVAPLAFCDEVSTSLLKSVNDQSARDGAVYQNPAYVKVIETMVAHGRTGKKAGAGFYDYPAEGGRRLSPALAELYPVRPDQPSFEQLKRRFLSVQALESARCLEEGVIAEPATADIGASLGWNFPRWAGGPLSYVDVVGVGDFVDRCDALADECGERFRPNELLRGMAARGEPFYSAAGAESGKG